MITIIDSNKRKVLALARATARRAKIYIPKEEDMKEQDGLYFIDLDVKTKEQDKLPVGLKKALKDEKMKTQMLEKAKLHPIKGKVDILKPVR